MKVRPFLFIADDTVFETIAQITVGTGDVPIRRASTGGVFVKRYGLHAIGYFQAFDFLLLTFYFSDPTNTTYIRYS